jgi:P-type Ca2+ transporter type 2C
MTTPAPWHTLPVDDALVLHQSTSSGLAGGEAAARLKQHGPNELQTIRRESAWHTLAAQFRNALIVILLCATVISGFLGHTLEAAVISVIVLLAVLLGFLQEYRASRALDALRRMAAPAAHVLRDGHEAAIPAREVVPGDVVVLRAGDRVPADCRLIQSVNLAIDEAALTGESEPVQKTTDAFGDPHLSLGDRRNLAYAGTLVTHGRGLGLVVSTGMATEFGHIARMVETVVVARTPLQDNLDRLGTTLGKAALGVVALIVAVGLFRGQPVIEMFMFGIALAVAVVPEALPAVVTISLAIGVRRMVRRQALVRRLPIVETLGSTSVICSDKTGTLTRNEMTVRQVLADGAIVEVTGAGYDTTPG